MRKVSIGLAVIFLLSVVWWALNFGNEDSNGEVSPQLVTDTGFSFVHDPINAGSGKNVTQVADFLQNGITIPDSANPGSYILAGNSSYCLDEPCSASFKQNSFAIEYTESNHYFSILLLEEPIREARFAAEDFLQAELAVTFEQMCDLNYSLTVPFFVNQHKAGEDLGFSFCEGSVTLQ